jgi:hypothetical protein
LMLWHYQVEAEQSENRDKAWLDQQRHSQAES